MPIVTALRRPKTKPGNPVTRIVIEIDGEPLPTCSDMLVGEFGLRPELELTQVELAKLTRRINETEAVRTAGKLLSQQLMTRGDLANKMRGRGLEPDVVDAALGRLEEDGFVDDLRYARLFVKTRIDRGHGERKIRADLSKRGVDRAVIDRALAEEMPSAEGAEADATVEQLASMVIRKYKAADWSQKRDLDRAARYLAGRGHGWNVIGPVLDRVRGGDLES